MTVGENRCIVRVTREEFELSDGSVFPIIPPLTQEISVEEFQKHYDYAVAVTRGGRPAGPDHPHAADDGSGRSD